MLFGKSKSAYDFLVVGLGNPGKEYEKTRHNVGFRGADRLHSENMGAPWKQKCKALVSDCRIGNKRVLLAKPQTFMNLSGQAVSELAKFYKIENENIIIIFDDISLPGGKIRVRETGSHGGHNGMKNISALMNSTDIPRVKLGVGEKPNPEYDLKDWVLGKFSKEEEKVIEAAVVRAATAVEAIALNGAAAAMNAVNS